MRNNHRPIPPGLSYAVERKAFGIALALTSLLSATLFFIHYSPARDNLYGYIQVGSDSQKILMTGVQIEDLSLILNRVLDPLLLLALCIPFWVLLHYLHYRRGSMSIYLMRRLPDRKLLHRQCWTLPLRCLALCAAVLLALLAIYVLIYIYATPAECLPLAYRRFVV